ncbi:MAG: hypothetical protein OXM55_07595, partial [Bdellovibrionales bacterium]|nr:hypothetical protein [Bdellovibrionales bacterium]
MRLKNKTNFYREYFFRHYDFIYKLTKSLKFNKFFIQNKKGVSLVEIIVFSSIFLIFITGTSRFLINTLKVQTLKHSQTSELNLSEMLKVLDREACLNTFSGKNIGDDLDHIRDKNGIPLISSPSLFKKNLKIVKMNSSARPTCNSIQVQSGQNCPPGCTNPGSFPGTCQGMGYAELHIFFSRPGSLFEKKSKTGACDSSDQSQCYKQSCIIELTGSPVRGNVGDSIGTCELLDCGASLDGSLSSNLSCYKVEDASGTPPKVSLVGCGTTQDITVEETVAIGFDAGSSRLQLPPPSINPSFTEGKNTFIGYRAGNKSILYGNTFIGPEAGEKNTRGIFNTLIGYQAGKSNLKSEHNVFIGPLAGEKNHFSSPTYIFPYEWPYHVFIGSYAGQNNRGYQNIFIGYKTGQENTIGKDNVFIGYKTGHLNETGKSHVFIGQEAGKENTGGRENIFIGYQAGKENTAGVNNVFIGPLAGEKNETGSLNTFIGPEAGQENTIGSWNTFIGYQAGKQNINGNQNVFIGYKAGSSSNHNNHFVVGNELNNEWITGEIKAATDPNPPVFKIQGQQVAYCTCPSPPTPCDCNNPDPIDPTKLGHTHGSSSSRTLKKNIKSFKNFD